MNECIEFVRQAVLVKEKYKYFSLIVKKNGKNVHVNDEREVNEIGFLGL